MRGLYTFTKKAPEFLAVENKQNTLNYNVEYAIISLSLNTERGILMKFIKKISSFAAAFLMTASLNCGVPFAVAEKSAEGLCINEVCTQNKSSFKDSLGRASDWIELYNGSSADIDLYGFGLSDSAEDPMKYIFPSGTVIKKGGYLLIAANKDGNGMTELNTGFALSKSGETLMLSAPDGNVVQKLDMALEQRQTKI